MCNISKLIYILCFFGGWAGLTWELLWFHHAGLAIGVSAKASAIVLISVMLGISFGAILAGRAYRHWHNYNPLKIYALLEFLIGVSGTLIVFGFDFIKIFDNSCYQLFPSITTTLDFVLIVILLILPTTAMGATIVAFAEIAENNKLSISGLYSANVAGAAFGVLAASFLLIPYLGIQMTTGMTSCINILVALILFITTFLRAGETIQRPRIPANHREVDEPQFRSLLVVYLIVFCTGFATFNLEISWFRSLRAAFQATSESFALMLSAVLIGLTAGAVSSPKIRLSGKMPLNRVLLTAVCLVFISTPLIERMDLLIPLIKKQDYFFYTLYRAILCLLLLGVPSAFIGIALPWVIDENDHTKSVSMIYAMNTLGAVIGSIVASWMLLPTIGFARSAWIAGGVLLIPTVLMNKKETLLMSVTAMVAIAIAVHFESGVGRVRFQNPYGPAYLHSTLIANQEGPDSTVAVIERPDGVRDLLIDGFSASCNSKNANYMSWMGRLPMIFHKNPKQALVICFGTGQTASAVLQEAPQAIDIVDISQAVYSMAPYFQKVNGNVLNDSRVTRIVMDGRIWMQRTKKQYDIITLEPMPPTFSGTNSLYSKEFYELCHQKMRDGGILAQWLPLHLVSPIEAASIVRTFFKIFPDSRLWIDPISLTGILLGKRGASTNNDSDWTLHGLRRVLIERNMNAEEIERAIAFDRDQLRPFFTIGAIITDDNQYLSYGYGRTMFNFRNMQGFNFKIIEKLTGVRIDELRQHLIQMSQP